MSDYLLDPSAPPEKDIAALEELLSPLAYREELDWQRASAARDPAPSRRRRGPVLALVVALAAAAVLIGLRLLPDSAQIVSRACSTAAVASAPWGVQVLAGEPRCGGTGTSDTGALNTGGWIETDASSSARLAVANIGEIVVEPSSRLALTATGPDRHRLELARGRIHATVEAPPRLFVVGTPAAEAVDLGCEYDLAVDADGVAHITVTGGAVSLEGGDRTVLVPAGFRARSLPARGPTPSVSIDASPEFFDHVLAYFIGRKRADLDAILAGATQRDTLTLEGLLPLVARTDCPLVHNRLIELSPTPFPWEQTDFGCHDVAELIEGWRGLLSVEAENQKNPR